MTNPATPTKPDAWTSEVTPDGGILIRDAAGRLRHRSRNRQQTADHLAAALQEIDELETKAKLDELMHWAGAIEECRVLSGNTQMAVDALQSAGMANLPDDLRAALLEQVPHIEDLLVAAEEEYASEQAREYREEAGRQA